MTDKLSETFGFPAVVDVLASALISMPGGSDALDQAIQLHLSGEVDGGTTAVD
ncbi:MAG TPA: hypothetical protein VIG24_19205 [Acidimicrobiia bacterium]